MIESKSSQAATPYGARGRPAHARRIASFDHDGGSIM